MSAPVPSVDAPLARGLDDRLHNSGWGRPPEQYRTPCVGARFRLDYMALLRAWRDADPADAATLAAVEPRHPRVPRELVARYAWHLARALGHEAGSSPDADAIKALAALVGTVQARGLVRGIVLTARPGERYKHQGHPVSTAVPTTEQVAVALATVASCSAPLVLFGREPSLGRFRPGHLLVVTRLRRAEAGPEAERVWSGLQALGEWRGA